jgi:hypothetical protein
VDIYLCTYIRATFFKLSFKIILNEALSRLTLNALESIIQNACYISLILSLEVFLGFPPLLKGGRQVLCCFQNSLVKIREIYRPIGRKGGKLINTLAILTSFR